MQNQSIAVFVISLARAESRRVAIVEHLKKLGVSFYLIDAVDGQLIPNEERRALQAEGVDYHPGVIGCYLSHMNAYRKILSDNIKVSLILEDDARLNHGFVPAIRHGIQSLDFDYCFLDCQGYNESGPVFYNLDDKKKIITGFYAYAVSDGPATTHAYMITLEAAARRLAHELPIAKPIDIYSTLPYRPRFRVLVSPPGAGVSEDSMRSFASVRDHAGQLGFRSLRRLPFFYTVREFLSSRRWMLRWQVPALMRAGRLPSEGRWRPLPAGRRILF